MVSKILLALIVVAVIAGAYPLSSEAGAGVGKGENQLTQEQLLLLQVYAQQVARNQVINGPPPPPPPPPPRSSPSPEPPPT